MYPAWKAPISCWNVGSNGITLSQPVWDFVSDSSQILQVAYDVYVFLLTILNALNRPRKRNSEMMELLKRDGIITFMVKRIISVSVAVSNWYRNSQTLFGKASVYLIQDKESHDD